MEELSGDDSDCAESARDSERNRLLGEKLFVQCGAHLLAIVLVLLVYGAWNLLQDYRDAILWAVLCSVTLRDLKGRLVDGILQALDSERSLCSLALNFLKFPVAVPYVTLEAVWLIIQPKERQSAAYQQHSTEERLTSVSHLERPSAELQEADSQEGADAGCPDRSKAQISRAKSYKKKRSSGVLSEILRISKVGLRAYRARKADNDLGSREKTGDGSQSFPLLSGLLMVIVIYQGAHLLKSVWSSAVNLHPSSQAVLALIFSCLLTQLILTSLKLSQKRNTRSTATVEAMQHKSGQMRNTHSKTPSSEQPKSSSKLYAAYRKVDACMKKSIAASVHSLVAAALVLALVICTSCLIIYLSVQIGQESTAAVRAVHDAARTWADMDTRSPPAKGTVGMGRLLQDSLPVAAEWAEAQVNTAIESHNLTQARDDMKQLYASILPGQTCSTEQKQQYLIKSARASVESQKALEEHDAIQRQMDAAKERLQELLKNLESQRKMPLLHGHSDSLSDTEEAVVELDSELLHFQKLHLPAHRAMQEAAKKKTAAQESLERCLKMQQRPVPSNGNDRVQQLGILLHTALNHFSCLHLQDGMAAMQSVGTHVARLTRDAISGDSGQLGGYTLNRLTQVAAEPLVALSRSLGGFLASSTYFTTIAALTGSLGIFRLGLGILKSAVQVVVFLALLFYLLAAKYDPVAAVLEMVPLPPDARLRISSSVERSMRGILLCTAKLAFFHAMFTWLTFRWFEVHLVYLSCLASAVLATMPFIPSWLVSLPAAAQLLLIQDRPAAAVLLLLAHLVAWYTAADIILREIPSTHPYLTCLGIFGGIATFSNPVQGAVFGPMALSILTLAYNMQFTSMADSSSMRNSRSSMARFPTDTDAE